LKIYEYHYKGPIKLKYDEVIYRTSIGDEVDIEENRYVLNKNFYDYYCIIPMGRKYFICKVFTNVCDEKVFFYRNNVQLVGNKRVFSKHQILQKKFLREEKFIDLELILIDGYEIILEYKFRDKQYLFVKNREVPYVDNNYPVWGYEGFKPAIKKAIKNLSVFYGKKSEIYTYIIKAGSDICDEFLGLYRIGILHQKWDVMNTEYMRDTVSINSTLLKRCCKVFSEKTDIQVRIEAHDILPRIDQFLLNSEKIVVDVEGNDKSDNFQVTNMNFNEVFYIWPGLFQKNTLFLIMQKLKGHTLYFKSLSDIDIQTFRDSFLIGYKIFNVEINSVKKNLRSDINKKKFMINTEEFISNVISYDIYDLKKDNSVFYFTNIIYVDATKLDIGLEFYFSRSFKRIFFGKKRDEQNEYTDGILNQLLK
jgi:hypothetical protein